MQNILSNLRSPRAAQKLVLILIFFAVLLLPRIEIAEADSSTSNGEIQSEQIVDQFYPTNTPTPNYPYDYDTPTPTATVIFHSPLPTPRPQNGDALYVSSSTGGKVSGIRFQDEDILAFDPDTNRWAIYFDGSDVGLKKKDVNAFHLLNNGDLLMSFNTPAKLGGVKYDDSDIVYFTASSLGSVTTGSFSMYFDGSDVNLDAASEDIDAIALDPNGDLIISTLGTAKIGFTAKDEDLLRFQPTRLGADTSGIWHHYFDGSDVDLKAGSEDLWAVWLDRDTNEIHLSTQGKYKASTAGTSQRGDGDDIFVCNPLSLGSSIQCNFRTHWNGDNHDFGKEKIDGYSVGPMIAAAVQSASTDDSDASEEDDKYDSADDDVLEEEDITSQIYLPMVSQP